MHTSHIHKHVRAAYVRAYNTHVSTPHPIPSKLSGKICECDAFALFKFDYSLKCMLYVNFVWIFVGYWYSGHFHYGKFCLKNDCRLIANTIWFSQPVPNINNKKCSKFLFCVLFKCVYVLKYFTGYKYERQYALTYNVVVTYIHANTNHINYKVHN